MRNRLRTERGSRLGKALAPFSHWAAHIMDIQIFSRSQLPIVLGALRNIATGDGPFSAGERALVEGIARIHQQDLAIEALPRVSFAELARAVVDPQQRKRALQLAIVMSLVDGTPSHQAEQRVAELARELEGQEEGLAVLYEVSHGHALFARFDMLRRFSRFLRSASGFPGVHKVVPTMLGLWGADPKLAARYQALAACPRGSLGLAFYQHHRDNEFKFPGELGGMPMIFHDLGHVLAGYGTDPQGEIQQAAFQAGFARHDGFTFLLFGILQFHLGLRVTPIAQGYRDLFDVPRVIEALGRGAACKVDLSAGYDLFADKERPLDEVRAELGITPATARAA
jgi:hypothetical protein